MHSSGPARRFDDGLRLLGLVTDKFSPLASRNRHNPAMGGWPRCFAMDRTTPTAALKPLLAAARCLPTLTPEGAIGESRPSISLFADHASVEAAAVFSYP